MAMGYCSVVVVFIIIDLILKSEACMRTIPVTDILQTCLVRSTPFGTFSPAAGNRIPDGGTATLTCNPFTRLDGTVTTATCLGGVLSSTSLCLPCPDDTTWVFDRTTNRCFKAFPERGRPYTCFGAEPCSEVTAALGTPTTLAYTFNFQALLDAAAIGISDGVGVNLAYLVGIGDPITNDDYMFNDGTHIPLASITPYFVNGIPGDSPANIVKFLSARFISGQLALDDDFCSPAPFDFGAICQLQL
uniref:Sushi domain-containing protein n=1 Tax=Plectus sambesii TaxID=2011161 RepID=A0A914XII5_9BILA